MLCWSDEFRHYFTDPVLFLRDLALFRFEVIEELFPQCGVLAAELLTPRQQTVGASGWVSSRGTATTRTSVFSSRLEISSALLFPRSQAMGPQAGLAEVPPLLATLGVAGGSESGVGGRLGCLLVSCSK